MADPVRLLRHFPLKFSWVLLLAVVGCQEQTTLPQVFTDAANGPSADLLALDPCADHPNEARLVQEMLTAINAERTKRHLRALKLNPTLTQIADFYACRLVDGRFFDHVDPYDGSTVDTRAADFGYAFLKIGENLARQQRTAAEVMSDLMASPKHRANLLDPVYTEIGIAVKGNAEVGPYWVQEFGQPIRESSNLPVPTVEAVESVETVGATTSHPAVDQDD